MPEGDSIHHAARRIGRVVLGGPLDRVVTPSPRTAPRGWDRRLAGREVVALDPRGKHLLIRFDDGLVLHSHLRMTGSWRVRPAPGGTGPDLAVTARPGAPARRGAGRGGRPYSARTWLVLGRGEQDVLQIGGPFLELRTSAQVAGDPRLAALGPDLCAEAFDADRAVARLRQDDPTRPVGDALLDQRSVAGIGNVWKSEGCFAAAIDPWRPLGRTTDDELHAILAAVRPGIRRCAVEGTHLRPKHVYGKQGRPCPRCGTTIRSAAMGDDNRTTSWCPGCQR
ncbi:DNA-formamidopyrimidine glycosylase family protein [Patulibacter brassicae]|uniref:DNA-(apurinic or apyrimidinic site) lyase n=1 Tax=Patulibacter brassicae TaxID=1705717 RepID=A0ABU4VL60_9ACTN|nr:DNA-formamidopyrimidine glycosylase family protein [Patulibacter brassicae]MDX8152577.1 DNA-formamidopyrimidine glycosylase family protein [Patulibacter brassicae]